ncbi:uncharacterized protein B0H64DRAFT_337782 [Chaetomium fimeti]|uniref:Azaphilone pigments biosynthesis cluster protein L N-terminal domain-containing protein n=1 Tax=Chaetomium fimeti TaxID=1854472 RepID=A0AAE0HNC9_9PEZI|nr:hypothetical protein B0H64DRAFT_337782 [Chaetomium fimeti]
MDPLSITAGAVSLAANVLRSAAFVKEAVDQFRDAPALARDIEHEIKVVQAALRQVEAALQRDPQAIKRLSLDDVFELSVEGCWDTLQDITHEFETLFGRHDWRLRVAVWWNSGDIRRLLGRLETKKGSLMLLVQALSLHSVQEMQELLQENMRTLDIARLGLDDMVPSYPAYTAKELDSTASGIDSGDSMLGDRDSVVSNTRFIFDDICFDSKPYRHTVARVSAKERYHHKRGEGSSSAGAPRSTPGREAEAEAEPDMGTLRKTEPRIQPNGVTPEEHEAVVMKLREAEALIRILQGRVQPPGTVLKEQQTSEGPNERRGTDVEPYIVPEIPATDESRRRTTRRADGARDLLLEKKVAQARPKATIKSAGKTSSVINQRSVLPDGLPVAAGSTRGPSRSRATPSNKEVELLIEYFKEGKHDNSKPSIKVHSTPSDEGKPQRIIVTNLCNGTARILDADTGRDVTSICTPDIETQDAPTATGPTAKGAPLFDHPRPLPGPESLLSQARARSAIARTTNPIFGHGASGMSGTRIVPESNSLDLWQAPQEPVVNHNTEQPTPEDREEVNEVFRHIVPPARPNHPLPLLIEDELRGSDIDRTKQTNGRPIANQRPYLSDDPRPLGMDVQRAIGTTMENTVRSVDASAVPTGSGTHPYPQPRRPFQARVVKEDEKAKKQSVFIRAFKGLGSRSNKELAGLEETLMQLLIEVEQLKSGENGVVKAR